MPIRMRLAALSSARTNSPGLLILYPDRLTHVRTRVANWCAGLGFAVVAALSFALAHAGPGALGGLIGAGGGQAIGSAIARRQAPRKVAAGGPDITSISLDSITGLTGRKAGRLRGWLTVVTTLQGSDYTFRANPAQWSADLAAALAARGRIVQASPDGLAVVPA
jgi:hypothetical protein